jgi:hypothetical protein
LVAEAEVPLRVLQDVRRQLAVRAVERHELRPAGKQLGRAAFVHRDMRLPVAINRAPGRAERGERQRVRRCAGRDQKAGDRMLEEIRETAIEDLGQRVAAIGGRRSGIRAGDRVEDFRRDAGRVVADEGCGDGHAAS